MLEPSGQRLPKWKKLFIPSNNFVPIKAYNNFCDPLESTKKVPADLQKGNLPFGLYRYFVGDPLFISKMAKCRACELTTYSDVTRLEHFKNKVCTRNLTKAYKYLCRTFPILCVVCNEAFPGRRWGLPLHVPCQRAWMFTRFPQKSLQNALQESKG